ncbi:MAG TPA: glycosyltransferase family 4 protein, partial [Bacteroidales bacterium]|nr:glycosyltransferase family 4 protein [Bacteroidales bacterium]
DIYVAPSLAESFGVAVLEASACELPVVVTNVGGLPEVVIHEQTGFIVEKSNINQMYEAIYKLINDKNLRIHLGKNGKAFIEKQYPWHDNVNKVINIYNELLNNK